jgi:hypothetical protein
VGLGGAFVSVEHTRERICLSPCGQQQELGGGAGGGGGVPSDLATECR